VSELGFPSYPKVYALGHHLLDGLLTPGDPIVVQEKVDGSQFSFMETEDGELIMCSKGARVYPEAPAGLFSNAVETVCKLHRLKKLRPGYIYRGEAFLRPKHNVLQYDRVPHGHIMLFDVQRPNLAFVPPDALEDEAGRLGLEYVGHTVVAAEDITAERLNEWLQCVSQLGATSGVLREGVVLKNYNRYGRDGKPLFGKYVSERFKEVHRETWKVRPGSSKDAIERLITDLRTDARWEKAVQHLAERGELLREPKDIGSLIREVQADVKEEELDYITKRLLDWALPAILRGVVRGLPEWYKRRLADTAMPPGPSS
jgi:hypothetical protein